MQALYSAWQLARRRKQPSMNQLAFEANWLDALCQLKDTLDSQRWRPRRTVCFVASYPKTREIHAPDFADRVVHHYLVPHLQRLWESVFIDDSFANRCGKGSHKAVERLQHFMRSLGAQAVDTTKLQTPSLNPPPVAWVERSETRENSGAEAAPYRRVHPKSGHKRPPHHRNQASLNVTGSHARPLNPPPVAWLERSEIREDSGAEAAPYRRVRPPHHRNQAPHNATGLHTRPLNPPPVAWIERSETREDQRAKLPGFAALKPGYNTDESGFYLQLDIHNFFISLDRRILYQQLCHRFAKAQRKGLIDAATQQQLRWLCHILVNQKPAQQARYRGTREEHNSVPAHKRLINARPGCGMAVGNLTSQFFSNVYLNALDQFIKHKLKCRHYLRYVDDFILLHEDPQQLIAWRDQLQHFLAAELNLRFKLSPKGELPQPQPLHAGCDFLGFIVYPHHKLVRQRVVKHCKAKLQAWQLRYISSSETQWRITLNDHARQKIEALVASYWGHFSHAQHWRLTLKLLKQFPWLNYLFVFTPGQRPRSRLGLNARLNRIQFYQDQLDFFRYHYRACRLEVQKGYRTQTLQADPCSLIPQIKITESGYHRHGLKRRVVSEIRIPKTIYLSNFYSQQGERPWKQTNKAA